MPSRRLEPKTARVATRRERRRTNHQGPPRGPLEHRSLSTVCTKRLVTQHARDTTPRAGKQHTPPKRKHSKDGHDNTAKGADATADSKPPTQSPKKAPVAAQCQQAHSPLGNAQATTSTTAPSMPSRESRSRRARVAARRQHRRLLRERPRRGQERRRQREASSATPSERRRKRPRAQPCTGQKPRKKLPRPVASRPRRAKANRR